MASPIVGIDLGTTHSAVGICEAGVPRLFANPLGEVLTPSAVAQEPRGKTLVVGRTAKDLIATDPDAGAARFKIDIAGGKVRRVGDRELTAIELSAHVLDALRADAERALGQPVTRAVITVPAYFDDAQRAATRQAGELAGLAVERILNEPTAAAIAYGLDRRHDESRFAVVDLGGGTFDVCVMERFEGVLQVVGVAGESRLGGDDFTDAVARRLIERAGIPAPAEGSPAAALLQRRAELCKRTLSRWPVAEVELPAELGGRTIALEVAEVEAAWAPLLERMRGPLRAALTGAGARREDLAEIVLVGGATRVPCVRRTVEELLGRAPTADADPDRTVALGAAIQAALLADDAAVADLVVTDVASHSLGVDTTRTIGARMVEGFFSPVIHRNTVIPTSRWEHYSTLHDHQAEVVFGIFEGDARKVADNRRLGELRVRVPRMPAPVTVRVHFTLDVNGMLEVEAVVEATGEKVSRVFRRDGGELSPAELEAARARLRALRADPMDRPQLRDLDARAALLWREAGPDVRAVLSPLMDALTAAAEGRNPGEIERAAAALRAACERIDGGERW